MTEIYPLNTIYFYLTQGCNLACQHCWLAPKFDPGGDPHPVLPVELFELAIREAKPLGLSGVKLTGGEPLLHPRIFRVLEIVRSEQLALTIETNGVLCTPDLALEIAKSPDSFVSVSLDGADAATHDRIRGVPGSFDRAVAGVCNLVGSGLSPQIVMSVMRANASQVPEVVKLAESLGASSVKFNLIQPIGRGEAIHETSSGLDVHELIELGRFVDLTLARQTSLRLFFDYPIAFRPLSRMFQQDGRGACGILGIVGVLPSGHWALCGIGEQVPELVFGRLGIDRLA
jgi:SynChlorMet cassette radical SAM/SPASM protein ScmF